MKPEVNWPLQEKKYKKAHNVYSTLKFYCFSSPIGAFVVFLQTHWSSFDKTQTFFDTTLIY